MTNANVKQFADELSDVLLKMADLKVEADAIRDAAKEAGITVATLNKVAKELITDASKLAKKYASEEQLDMFRAQVGIFKRKGLDDSDKAASASSLVGEKKLRQAAKEFDAVAGTDIAGGYAAGRKKVNKYIAGQAGE